jgi:hypothetical protein
MSNNHLIIGLGGTGGKVLAAYRRLVFENFKGNLNPENVWVDYIYVDSSEKDLNETGGIWNVLGTSVSLDNGSLTSIKAANLKQYIENIDNYPYLKPWIGTAEEWKNIINDPKVQHGAAGQKRRLGRFLFANRADEFNKTVDAKVRKLQSNPKGQNITFHICTGLAGGTGSGSFIDSIVQIRKNYKDIDTYKIILYLLLPEEVPNKAWATTDNYQPNGYAALSELNALDYFIFKPYDIGEREYQVKRLENELPFYSAYIITEQNKENIKFDVDKVLPSTIAEFIYQKTIVVADNSVNFAAKDSMLNRAEAGENPKYSEYGYQHSFKFLIFGIKRLAIPEQEIKEYFAYNFAKQAVLQFIYNNPSNEIGYQDEPLPNDNYSEVYKNENLNRWNLTVEHLCLSIPVLGNHKTENWKRINEDVQIAVTAIKNEIFSEKSLDEKKIKKELWLDAITNKTREYYDKGFRALGQAGGVLEFYKTKRKVGLEELARKIVSDIESDMFGLWNNSVPEKRKSFIQISEMLKNLNVYLINQVEKFDKMTMDARKTISDIDPKLKEINAEWVKIGLIGKWFDKDDKLLDAFTNYLIKKYQMQVWIEGYTFGKDLIVEVCNGVLNLKKTVDETNGIFNEALKIFTDESNSKCNDDLTHDTSKQSIIVKHYNAGKVREIATQVLKRRSFLDEQIKSLRDSIVNMMGEGNKKFSKINQQIQLGGIVSQMQIEASNLTELFFNNPNNVNEIPKYEKLIGENIIKKLKEEFSGNDIGLKAKITELIKHASVLSKYDEPQKNDGPKVREGLLVVLPEYKEDEIFLKKIKDIFASFQSNENFQFEIGKKENEIVIINIESNIALRYLKSTGVLRSTYDRLVNSDRGKVAKFETHLENFTNLPSIYKLSQAEKEQLKKEIQLSAIPYLLIAKAADIIETTQDEHGNNKLGIIFKTEYGTIDDSKTILLDKTLDKSLSKIENGIGDTLKEVVDKYLSFKYRNEQLQADLIKKVVENLNDLIKQYDNNKFHPVIKEFNTGANKAIEIIKKLND